ncbi:hypothetical protein BAMA_16220 [Bacillus manliponensis]|uniref:Cell division protein SepF n=1 Tax=Bacillus manliponensis TaxID=574376 RepID=A0A073K4L9_9BACI|nr:hypothetical protein [Bacillus manliponensis]KEK17238.1 hypothetical protein BAMA_16220 [Bacillus manliponensis]
MTEQITFLLDDCGNIPVLLEKKSFDMSEARVQRQQGQPSFVDVFAIIPVDAKSMDELPRTFKADEKFDLFIDYVTAIWRYHRSTDKTFTWDAAEELCKAARNAKEPISIRIYLDSGFRPERVTEYL